MAVSQMRKQLRFNVDDDTPLVPGVAPTDAPAGASVSCLEGERAPRYSESESASRLNDDASLDCTPREDGRLQQSRGLAQVAPSAINNGATSSWGENQSDAEGERARTSARLKGRERVDYRNLKNPRLAFASNVHSAGFLALSSFEVEWAASAQQIDKEEVVKKRERDAILNEVDQLIRCNVLAPVESKQLTEKDLRSAIPSVMLSTDKTGADGLYQKTKARFVVKGFHENNSDFRTDSPTVHSEVVLLVLNIAASQGYGIDVFDVRAAFLEASLEDRHVLVSVDKELAKLLMKRSREFL